MIRIELATKTRFMDKPRHSVQFESTMEEAREYVEGLRRAMPDAEVTAEFFDKDSREADIAAGKV